MSAPLPTRVILIVLDSVGIGELPDARAYGDEGSNTVANIAKRVPLRVPTLRSLGFDRIVDIGGVRASPRAAAGRMAEASAGKDSVTGHWEMMGIVLDRPFPTFPHGFSADVIAEFSRRTRRGRKACSGERKQHCDPAQGTAQEQGQNGGNGHKLRLTEPVILCV